MNMVKKGGSLLELPKIILAEESENHHGKGETVSARRNNQCESWS